MQTFIGSSARFLMMFVDTAMVGHIGTEYLASVATSDVLRTSFSMFSQCFVLKTLCSQAYGAGKHELVGQWVWVSIFCTSLLAVPFMFIAFCSYFVFNIPFFSITPAIAFNASYFTIIIVLSYPAQILESNINSWLQSLQILKPSVIIAFMGIFLNLFLGLLFNFGIGWPALGITFGGFGFTSLPIVTSCVMYLMLLLQVYGYLYYKLNCLECFDYEYYSNREVHKRTFVTDYRSAITVDRVQTYMKLHLPAACSLASDYWRYNIIAMMANSLSYKDLATFNISYRLFYLVMMFTLSYNSGVILRVNWYLGRASSHDSYMIGMLGMGSLFAITFTFALFILFFSDYFILIFSADPDIINNVKEVNYILVLTMIFMIISSEIGSFLNGIGKSKLVFYNVFIINWLVHIPSCWYFTYYSAWQYTLKGLYIGMLLGYVVTSCCLLIALGSVDWNLLSEDVKVRNEHTLLDNLETEGEVDGTGKKYFNELNSANSSVVNVEMIDLKNDKNTIKE